MEFLKCLILKVQSMSQCLTDRHYAFRILFYHQSITNLDSKIIQ